MDVPGDEGCEVTATARVRSLLAGWSVLSVLGDGLAARYLREVLVYLPLAATILILVWVNVAGLTDPAVLSVLLLAVAMSFILRQEILAVSSSAVALVLALHGSAASPTWRDVPGWMQLLLYVGVATTFRRPIALTLVALTVLVSLSGVRAFGPGSAAWEIEVDAIIWGTGVAIGAILLIDRLVRNVSAAAEAAAAPAPTGLDVRTERILAIRRWLHHDLIALLRRAREDDAVGWAATEAGRVLDLLPDRGRALPRRERAWAPLRGAIERARTPGDLTIRVVEDGERPAVAMSGATIRAVVNAVEELARNAVLHGAATHLTVRLGPGDRIEITDNGTPIPDGFRPGQGLTLVADQLRQAGADIAWRHGVERSATLIDLPGRDDRGGRSRSVSAFLRPALTTATIWWCVANAGVGIRHLRGGATGALQVVLLVGLSLLALRIARRLDRTGAIRAPVRIGAAGVAIAAGATGTLVAPNPVLQGSSWWMLGSASLVLSLLALSVRAAEIGAYAVAHAIVVLALVEWVGGAPWGALSGGLWTACGIPLLFFAIGERVRAIERLLHDQADLAADLRTRAAWDLSDLLGSDFVEADVLPFLAAVRDDVLTGADLRRAATSLEIMARFEYALPGVSDRWLRTRLATASARGVRVTVYSSADTVAAAGRGRTVGHALGEILPEVADRGQVTVSLDREAARIDILPAPSSEGLAVALGRLPAAVRVGIDAPDDVMASLTLRETTPWRVGAPHGVVAT